VRPRAIHQLSVSAAYGDAIGNEAMEIRDALRGAGYDSDIFVELVDPRMAHQVRPYQEYREISGPDNVVLLHYSLGSKVSALARELPDKLVLIYHNITPPAWFAPYNFGLARDCALGRVELAGLRDRCVLGLGDSEYNRIELEQLGFAPTGVLPLFLDLDRFEGPADPVVLERFADGRTTLLFVGRVVPNKSFEDILRAFAYYQRWVDHRARLVVVGEFRSFAPYYDALQALVTRLDLDEVHFVGHVTESELSAYYRVADVFVCMSEHEGFCVPLFEAMQRGIPVVAFDAAAIPYSTGEGVLMIRDKDPAFVAETIALVLADDELRTRLIERQRRALELVSRDRVMSLLVDHLRSIGVD
jgi:glycosyltransferase involved in cell wall biosynthesis